MKVEIPSQHRVLGRYGADAQAMVHCEELSELIQAISKMRRARNGGQDDAEAYSGGKWSRCSDPWSFRMWCIRKQPGCGSQSA